ncbi:hypothetical protein HALO59_120409 [Halomonas sp. 59]|nr:hypothetical protein HALO113_120408 [Halomonas sp. 113]CAD5253307.1 hypothetical protein HALO59_120409 [Halomonas sp. 59]CAD5261484.1 hypothetical protein HALOI3_170119 [Halomonas sp. I3]CAD5294150.1 hypothetical protein HALO156_80009 [Halomonas sp. 156]VXB13280.1 hypothetical protein HALO98_130148 [Halomonas titanicae]
MSVFINPRLGIGKRLRRGVLMDVLFKTLFKLLLLDVVESLLFFGTVMT